MVPVCTFQIAGRQYSRIVLGWLIVIGAFVVMQPATSHAQTVVRDIDNPAQRPFQVELRQKLTLIPTADRESFTIADVPAGSRLVIEHVSFRVGSLEAVVPGSRQTRFQINASLVTTADGVAANHELLATRTDFEDGSSNTASQPIRAYADGGSPVSLRIGGQTENGRSTLVSIVLTISGHLVDVADAAPPDGR